MAIQVSVSNGILDINPDLLEATATKISGMRDDMALKLNKAISEIEEISVRYKGKVSSENISKFNEYSAEFNKFYAKIDQYVTFLNQTASGYRETDEGGSSDRVASALQ